jgi:hypothetical protein
MLGHLVWAAAVIWICCRIGRMIDEDRDRREMNQRAWQAALMAEQTQQIIEAQGRAEERERKRRERELEVRWLPISAVNGKADHGGGTDGGDGG